MAGLSGLVYGIEKSQFSINQVKLLDTWQRHVKDKAFKALLITKGRKSGREHSVWLRAVSYNSRIYFSRRNQNSDWLKNALASPTVKVVIDDKVHVGTATLVVDDSLVKEISKLKYPSEKRANESRIALQVILE